MAVTQFENLFKNENCEGLGLAQLPCGFHGFRNVRNTSFKKVLKETNTVALWKGNTDTMPALACFRRESAN